MQIKHSVMLGLMGGISDKFHEYHPPRTMNERLKDVQNMEGVDGIEVVYPSEFSDMNESVRVLKEVGIPLSAINLNVKSEKRWEHGSFTNPDRSIRSQAVEEMKIAMDLAAELGTDMVSCCPLIDGHNFCFEVNYLDQWAWLVEHLREGASHRMDIRISLEYKLNECRNVNILADMGRTLYLCDRVGLPNVGVTLDVGHALMARETPAEVLSLASASGRLFYVHFNDNDRYWDWDMIPGAVNLWEMLEVLYYLEKLDWSGWVSYDVVTRDGDIATTMEGAISNVTNGQKLLAKIGIENIDDCIANKSTAETFRYLMEALL